VTGEFLPKTLFRARPNLLLNIFAMPVFIFYILLYPVTIITIWLTNLILRIGLSSKVRITGNTGKPVFAMVDIDHLLNETQSKIDNALEEQAELKIFQNTLEFSRLKVRECMVPRTDITAIDADSPLEELQEKIIATGYSKILVYEESIDNITGYVNSKDLFKEPASIKSIQLPLFFVPETMQVNVLFNKLIMERKSIALVVDEYGGTSGIITLEDIMEEIFGEIEDEHDTPEFIEKQISETEFVFSARIEIDYINEKYDLGVPESEEYDTLAGFIIYNYENIPKQNTRIVIDPFQIRILKVSATRIELIHMKKLDDQ
jgi:CBS domain containing-hemolysin-like protein